MAVEGVHEVAVEAEATEEGMVDKNNARRRFIKVIRVLLIL